jgi:predicted small integral membrane protein
MTTATTPTRANWTAITLTAVGVMAALLAALFLAAPRGDEGLLWTDPLIPGGWMAWTLPVALFFWTIACLLVTMTLLAIRYPETPRVGILRIETTRGDRLFISLLGSGFLCLIWLFFAGPPLWGALALCLVYAAAVFRWV